METGKSFSEKKIDSGATVPAILDRKYEKFLGGPTQPPETRVHVSMDPRGVITMNATCYKMPGKPQAANLYFSRADNSIAIEPVDSFRLPTAFPFRPNSTARYLNSAPFCRHFGIKLDSTVRFLSSRLPRRRPPPQTLRNGND